MQHSTYWSISDVNMWGFVSKQDGCAQKKNPQNPEEQLQAIHREKQPDFKAIVHHKYL